MSGLQARTAARLAMKDQIRKLKEAWRRISDEGAGNPVPIEKIRERLKDARDEILSLQDRVTTLETKMTAAKAVLIDHEARIAVLERRP